jgi:hypothetical protein
MVIRVTIFNAFVTPLMATGRVAAFPVAPHPNPKGDPRQNQTGACARAAAATEAICAATGDRSEETAWRALRVLLSWWSG